MNTKKSLLAVTVATMLGGCFWNGSNGVEVKFAAQGIEADSFRVFAYTDEGGSISGFHDDMAVRTNYTDTNGNQIWSCMHDHGLPNDIIRLYAYTDCDGVHNVSTSKEKPLYLEYTSNPDPAKQKQGDLLIACTRVNMETDKVVDMPFTHALTWMSFVWDENDANDPTVKYKLHKLTVSAKQSGRMTISPESNEPKWQLITAPGDYTFLVYQAPDYDVPETEQTFSNPSEELLRYTNSLYLAPGTAVVSDVEYSVWKNNVFVANKEATDMILGGHENTASYLLYNTHYTYTYKPLSTDEPPMRVKVASEKWN